MVPVINLNDKPLMPCSEKRARKLMMSGRAKPMWKNQIFCIKLSVESSSENLQDVTIGIDPGSKREGITVTTDFNVILNILAHAKSNVKDNMDTRRNLRKHRRYRFSPCRKCRSNRKIKGLPPSIKSRWDQKLRIISLLRKILPITVINVENVAAKSKIGSRKWNTMFSPIQVGKEYFRNSIKLTTIRLIETEGYDTKKHRVMRSFEKIKTKMSTVWESHCVDSHSLCEIANGSFIKPFKGFYIFENFNFRRRSLHLQTPSKKGLRRINGGTVSLGVPRGSLGVSEKFGIVHIGGSSNGKLTLNNMFGQRLSWYEPRESVKILTINKWRTRFISA